MKLKDLIGISLISIFLFPLILLGIMLGAGVVHIEFGSGKDREKLKQTVTAEENEHQEEMEAKQLKAFKALEAKEKEVNVREAAVLRDLERLETLKLETMGAKDDIGEQRRRIEELVSRNSDLQDKQIASLAEVYGAMRPEEAAPILLSLKDDMVVKIMRKIPESRSTSKLMAALAALDVKRAARITEFLGGQAVGKAKGKAKAKPVTTPAASEEGKPGAVPPKAPVTEDKPASEDKPAPEDKQTEPRKKA